MILFKSANSVFQGKTFQVIFIFIFQAEQLLTLSKHFSMSYSCLEAKQLLSPVLQLWKLKNGD